MAGSLNKVSLIGNLGKDPKIAALASGDKAATFSLATSESWKDKNTGEKRERTEWHNIAIYNQGLIKIVESYLKKGSKAYVEGQLQTRKYNDSSGVERYITEVVLRAFDGQILLLGDAGARGPGPDPDAGRSAGASGARAAGGGAGAGPRPSDLDDDIPF